MDAAVSANPDQLGEITLGNETLSPEYQSLADGNTLGLVQKASGRMSPVRARTMKDYEQQIEKLTKENFSLKLRIYYLEEGAQRKQTGNSDELYKMNIELKIKVEGLKKDVMDKQELLAKAKSALDDLSTQHVAELSEAQQRYEQTKADLEARLLQAQHSCEKAQREGEESSARANDLTQVNQTLEAAYRDCEARCRSLQEEQALQQHKALRSSGVGAGRGVGAGSGIGAGSGAVDDSNYESVDGAAHVSFSQLTEEIRDKERTIEHLRMALKTKEVICEQNEEEKKEMMKQATAPLQARFKAVNSELQLKDREIKEQGHKMGCLEEEIATLREELKVHEENALKRDKAIQGLMNAVLQKDEQIQEQNHRCSCQDETILTLEEELDKARKEAERLRQSINKKESEVAKLSEKLDESHDVLRHREEAMQALLEDVQRELEGKEKSLQRLTKKVQEQGLQLDDYMTALTQEKPMADKQEALVTGLRQQVREKDKSIEDLVKESASLVQGKEREMSELKLSLRDREKAISKANQLLEDAEHTIQTLQQEASDKATALEQLRASVLKKDRVIEEMMQEQSQDHSSRDKLLALQGKLRAAEDTHAHLQNELSRQSVELNRQLHDAKSQILKKELDLKEAERRLREEHEQQDSVLERVRAALQDRDDTISRLTAATHQTPGGDSSVIVADLQRRVEALQSQLEQSRQENSTLQSRLSNRNQAHGDKAANGITPHNHATKVVGDSSNQGSDASRLATSYLPSFVSLPNIYAAIPDESALDEMSQHDLRELVGNLKCEMLRSQDSQLHSFSGKTLSYETMRDLESANLEVEHLEQILHDTESDRQRIKRQLDTVLYGPTSDRDVRIIPVLKEQLDEALHKLDQSTFENRPQISGETLAVQENMARLRGQLKQTENVNAHLKRQIELNSDCREFNPELVCQMALEIERLKDLLEKAGQWSRSSDCSSSDESQERRKKRHASGKSMIPKLQKKEGAPPNDTSAALERKLENVERELSNTKADNKELSTRLASTEATVRIQTDKMKFYRKQLEERGIAVRSPSPAPQSPNHRPPSPGNRYHSEVNVQVGNGSANQDSRGLTSGSVQNICRDTDLGRYNDYGGGSDVTRLKAEITDLKQHLGVYHRLNLQLQEKVRSGQSEAEAGTGGDDAGDAEEQSLTLASFYRFKAANEEAFEKLHNELEVRTRQLKSAEDLNASLIGQGDHVEIARVKAHFEHIMQELQNENIGLRGKLTRSKALCAVLRSRLSELGESVDELLQVDERGNLDVLHLSAGRVSDIKKQLSDTQNMTSSLSVSLKLPHNGDDLNTTARNIEVRQLGTSQHEDSTNQVDLDVSYQNACEQIQKLELQLSKRGEYEDLNTSRRIADTEQELDDLKHLNNELNKKIKEQTVKLKSFEQEKSLAKERATSLQQEVNRLRQEYLTLKEGLNSEQQNTARYVDQINSLQKELEKAQRNAEDLRGAVHAEQEKAHVLERDKDAVTWNVKRLTSERDSAMEERYGLEEKVIGLETLMAQLKDECNTLRVKHADQQAQIYRHETDNDKLRKTIESKDDVIEKFKELVQDNQSAAEKLREQCQQLNDEFEEKNNAVSSLRSKLQRLQQAYGIPASELVSDSGDLDFIPKPEVSEAERAKARKTAARESGAAQSRKQGGGNSRVANGSSLKIDLSDLADAPTPEESEKLQQEIYILKGQLQAERDLVESLKSEIKLQENMKNQKEKTSIGGQKGAGPEGGDVRLREHLEELRRLRLQLEESIEKNNKLEDLLTRQLTQLGVDGDAINQYIKSQLEQSAVAASGGGGEKQTARLLTQLDEVKREMDLLEQEVHGKDKEIELLNKELKKKDAIFKELEERIRTKDETLQVLTIENESKATQLIATTAEAKRLKDEMNRLKEALGENEELNKTLKLELSVYDKMAEESKTQAFDVQSLDLNMLLEEIRQLRIQMVKTIENNNKLRRTLEENLAKNRSPQQSMTNGDLSREELRGFNGTESPRHSGVRFAHSYHDYEHDNDALSPVATADSGLATYDDPLDDHRAGSYRDPLYGILGETYIDRYFARKGLKKGLRASSLSRSHTVTGRDLSPPTKLTDRSHSADARYLASQGRGDDTAGPLHAHELTNGKSSAPKQRLYNERSGSQHSPRTRRLMDSLHGSAKDNWRYDVTDPLRPPKYPSFAKSLDDSQSSGSTSQRVGADVRMLYAVGELDDYELLKKQIAESHFIINGIEVRVRERLRSHKHAAQTDSLDFHTYREVASSLEQLKSLSGEANRLIALFWLSQLPVRDEFGNFVDVKLLKENQALSDELAKYKKEYGRIKHKLYDASRKMEKTSRLRDSVQYDMMKQLTGHRTNLGRANTNLYHYGLELPASAR